MRSRATALSLSSTRAIAFAALLSVMSGPAWCQTVAMITDLTGQASVESGTLRAVSILAELETGTRLRLEPGARVVALYLKSGDEYSFTGPARVEIGEAAPRVLSGATAHKRASPLAGSVTINPGGVRQAAYVMRGGAGSSIRLLGLVATRIVDTDPEFRWQPIEGVAKYRLELTDGSGNVVVQHETDRSTYRLPESVTLQEGGTYTWEVSARGHDGRRHVGTGDFTVAAAAIRQQVKALQPPPDAPLSDRVAFAAWLEQQALRDEARKYWRGIAVERPGDARLRALAGQ